MTLFHTDRGPPRESVPWGAWFGVRPLPSRIFEAEDIRFRGSLGKYAVGNREFGHYVDYIHYAFPDFNNVIEEIISEDNKSFVQLTYQGTHQGEIFGIRLPQMVKITAPKSAK